MNDQGQMIPDQRRPRSAMTLDIGNSLVLASLHIWDSVTHGADLLPSGQLLHAMIPRVRDEEIPVRIKRDGP